jgi:hypothetical protein
MSVHFMSVPYTFDKGGNLTATVKKGNVLGETAEGGTVNVNFDSTEIVSHGVPFCGDWHSCHRNNRCVSPDR